MEYIPGQSISRILLPGKVCRSTVSWLTVISLGRMLPSGSCSLPGTHKKTSRFPPSKDGPGPCLALLPSGVAWLPHYCGHRWSLTPPFHPCPSLAPSIYLSGRRGQKRVVYFCGPIRQVFPKDPRPGCYPATRSVECGLSSTLKIRAATI
jgi:hypothetical protein